MPRFAWLVLLMALSLIGCPESETVTAKTQVTVRIHSDDDALLSQMTELRIAIWRETDSGWAQRSVGTVPAGEIRWPLDVPVTPSSKAAVDLPFEVIIEAWSGDTRLAQTRAVTKYVPDSARVLDLWILSCPRDEANYVCAPDDCHGTSCPACSADGACDAVGLRSADEIYNTSEAPALKAPPTGAPPTVEPQGDSGTPDAEIDLPPVVTMEAGTTMEAGSMMEASVPTTCLPACSSTAKCEVDAMGARCVCMPGYHEAAGGCEDVDECKAGTHTCSANATCQNTPGSYDCACGENFNDVSGDGRTCTDKCQGACDTHAACSVLDGEVSCQCTGAYTGNGKTCMLNPSCEMLNCGANSSCGLRAGSTNVYECRCLNGYQLANGRCEDIDECRLTPPTCGTGASCANTPGSRTCTCLTGYQRNATTGACENIDDCRARPCLNGGTCTDLVADFSCNCATTGFSGKQCQNNVPDCPSGACAGGMCMDGVNDYTCSCGTGYRVATNNKACQLVDCGALTAPLNGSVATPSGTTYGQSASYACNSGYRLSGTASRSCGMSGWGGSPPSCAQVLCPTLTNPGNGTVSVPSRAAGQSATYGCNSGYAIASGNMTRVCQDDGEGEGTWSGTPATCALACTVTDTCRPGDACLSNPDCGSGAICRDGMCLTSSCSGGTISDTMQIQNLRYCAEINGDLIVQMTNTGPALIELPHTTSILGNFTIRGTEVIPSNRTVTFGALNSVGGAITIGPSSGGNTAGRGLFYVNLPRLTRANNAVVVQYAANLSALDLGQLQTISLGFYLYYLDSLQTLRIGSLRSASEIITITVPNHPYDPVFTRLESIAGVPPRGFASVGCCIAGNQSSNCGVSSPPSFCL